jgi:inner membrane protein
MFLGHAGITARVSRLAEPPTRILLAAMSPASHLLISWLVAQGGRDRREWAAITLAGIIPDLDGLGLVAGLAMGSIDLAQDWYARFHHELGHNLWAGLSVGLLAWFWCRRSWRVAILVLVSFHLHLFCDVIGSRGPDGHQWPIPYVTPFSTWAWTWDGQWELNAWPNHMITLLAEAAMLWIAWRHQRSPLGLLSLRADAAWIGYLRRWFPPRAMS